MIDIIGALSLAISNILRIKPYPDYQEVEKALDMLAFLVKNKIIKHTDALSKICWSLSNYSANDDGESGKVDKIQKFLQRDILPELIKFLTSFS